MKQNIRSNYIGDIEILRAFAIILVMLGHFKFFLIRLQVPYTNEIFSYVGGGTGVDLFFVISGFVIARSLLPKLQETQTTQHFFRQCITFWIRRFWRLIPSSWLWLLIPLFLFLLFNQSGAFGTLKGNFAGLIAGLLNVYNIFFTLTFGNAEYTNATFVQWTLSLEAQFYLLLPFIIFLSRDKLKIVLLVLVLLQLVMIRTRWLLILRTDGFFIGVLIAMWQQGKSTYKDFEPTFLKSPLARIIFIGIILLGLMTMGGRLHIVPPGYRVAIASIISAIAVFAASYNQNYFIRIPWLKAVLLWIGSRSYAIYLIHIPVYKFIWEIYFRSFTNLPKHEHWLLLSTLFFATSLLLTFLISELNFRLIEEPFRLRGRAIAKNYFEKTSIKE